MAPIGWFERQSRARQRRLVLVVSAVCAGRYGAGRVVRRPETDTAVEVGVGIMSVRSKEMFMRFEKFSISSSLPGLLDRLRKCCAKVHCGFLAVYLVSEF